MGKFKLIKQFDLSWVGPEWGGCYLKFNDLTMTELKEVSQMEEPDMKDKERVKIEFDKTVSFLQEHLIEGKGINEQGQPVDILKEDIADLSGTIVKRAMSFLAQG